MKVRVTSNIREVMERAARIAKDQMPFATARALTWTAKAIQAAEVAEMKRVFDRPTPYALGGTYVKPATKTNLEARVWIKDEAIKGTPADRFLGPEIRGGERGHKRFEKTLIYFGLMPSDMYAVPGERAQLDRYGNISSGQIVQILSALGAGERTAGYSANRTARSRKRGKKADYFVGRPGNGKGPLGIWQKVGTGARPVVIFVRRPQYKPRLDFYRVANEVVASQFVDLFQRSFDDAVASRRS